MIQQIIIPSSDLIRDCAITVCRLCSMMNISLERLHCIEQKLKMLERSRRKKNTANFHRFLTLLK